MNNGKFKKRKRSKDKEVTSVNYWKNESRFPYPAKNIPQIIKMNKDIFR